jgi:hypothetical protein
MIHIFSRFEQKFVLNEAQKIQIQKFLLEHMINDIYSQNNRPYHIYNYYLDNDNYEVIRHSVSKPSYKHKIRMRYYNDSLSEHSDVFLEIKSKAFKRVNKRRVQMNLETAKNYLLKGIKPSFTDYYDNQIFNEIDYLVKRSNSKPKTYIQYERIAYIHLKSDLRITIDSNLKYQPVSDNLEATRNLIELVPKDIYLMEIKTGSSYPLWLVNYLSNNLLYSHSFSKYGRVFQHYIQGGSIDDLILYNKLSSN